MDFFIPLVRALLGLAAMIGICYALSNNRKAINWRTVGIGLGLQILLAIAVLRIPAVETVFNVIARFFVAILNFTEEGADFVLGDWPDQVVFKDGASGEVVRVGYIFAVKVLPTIIFFSALSSVLYFLGILQVIIKGFAWVMVRTMGLTGAESLAAAANVFIGQTEAPLIVKPYLDKMSPSEMLCLMTGGMATIAGGVFAAYVGFLGGSDPEIQQMFATHLLTASIMSAPAAIVAAKIIFPESQSVDLSNQKLDIAQQDVGTNILDAISRGTSDGLRLAVNVGIMLLVFTAFVAMLNYICTDLIGEIGNLNAYIARVTGGTYEQFSIEFMLGLLFAPVAWLLGVDGQDTLIVGKLLGLKTTLNEFFAYTALQEDQNQLSFKSVIIATYALCGFANFASIGIQIGGIGAIAPARRQLLTELGLRALIGGTIACFLTGTIAGLLVTAA